MKQNVLLLLVFFLAGCSSINRMSELNITKSKGWISDDYSPVFNCGNYHIEMSHRPNIFSRFALIGPPFIPVFPVSPDEPVLKLTLTGLDLSDVSCPLIEVNGLISYPTKENLELRKKNCGYSLNWPEKKFSIVFVKGNSKCSVSEIFFESEDYWNYHPLRMPRT